MREAEPLTIEVSPGELLDRISILQLKATRMKTRRRGPWLNPGRGEIVCGRRAGRAGAAAFRQGSARGIP